MLPLISIMGIIFAQYDLTICHWKALSYSNFPEIYTNEELEHFWLN